MIDRRSWPTLLLCSLVGGLVGYAGGHLPWPKLSSWLAVACLTYVPALGLVIVQSINWMRAVAETTGDATDISFDLGQEFVRLDIALTVAALAYFVSLAAPADWVSSGRLPFTLSGVACGATAVAVRLVWPRPISAGKGGQ